MNTTVIGIDLAKNVFQGMGWINKARWSCGGRFAQACICAISIQV